MKHGVKKIKFRRGKDANKMLTRKLLVNFLKKGKIVTTDKKAKLVKQTVEPLVKKITTDNKVNRSYLFKKLDDKNLVNLFIRNAASALKGKKGGYTRISKIGKRMSDSASISKVEWAYPVVLETEKKEDKEIKIKSKGKETKV